MNILDVCKVAPANPPSQFSLPLTFLDMSWLRLDPTSRIFFYKFPDNNTEFSNVFVKNLKDSLSRTLHHYLPISGNLTWPQDSDTPVVQYKTGDGVSLTISESQSDFYSLSRDGFRESVDLRSLLPDFPTSKTQSPVMTLKITIFPNIGFSIAYVAHHAVLDGKSVSMFLHSWAYLCKNGDKSDLPSELTPFFDRSFVENQSELKEVYPKALSVKTSDDKSLTVYDMNAPLDTVLGTWKLSRENIEFLKKTFLDYREKKNELRAGGRVSAFTVASAYAMFCLVKANEITVEKTFIGINVDARARLDPPLPSTYFGNCVLACGYGGETNKIILEKIGFLVAVEVVSEALNSLNEGVVKLAEKIEDLLISMFINFTGFVVAGSPRFELYKVDFGWGKPIKVDMVSIDKTGAFCLTDDRNENGGIEIGIGLKKHQADAFASAFADGLIDR